MTEFVEIRPSPIFQDFEADYYGHRCRFVEHSLWISFLCRQAFPLSPLLARLLRQQEPRHHRRILATFDKGTRIQH